MKMFLPLEKILTQHYIELPSKKSEKWHFSGLDSYLNQQYYLSDDEVMQIPFTPPHEGYWCHIYDGKILDTFLPNSVTITPTQTFEPNNINPFSDLAYETSLSTSTITLHKDIELNIYVEFSPQSFLSSAFNLMLEQRVNASVTINYKGAQRGFVTMHSDFIVGHGAHLKLMQIENFDEDAIVIAQNNFEIKEQAQSDIFTLLVKGQHLQHFVEAKLHLQSQIDINALLLSSHYQKEIFSCDITHLADKSQSHIQSKQVLKDHSTCVFDATTTIKAKTKACKAYQASHALLLDDKAQIHAKPHLEIYSDDLTASHGSTVGELDPDALAYLGSRGISETKAKAILVEAFINELIQDLHSDKIKEIRQLLGEHHEV